MYERCSSVLLFNGQELQCKDRVGHTLQHTYEDDQDNEFAWPAAQTLSETLEGLAAELDARADQRDRDSRKAPRQVELRLLATAGTYRACAQLLRDRAKGAGA